MSKTYVLFIIKISEIWGKRDMKKSLYFAFLSIFAFFGTVFADTETLNWIVDGQTYTTTTCESGGDIILPTPPSKPGYVFRGWKNIFTPIEYLQSTGTQYIDTRYYPNQDTDMELNVRYESGVSSIPETGEINGNKADAYAYYFTYNQLGWYQWTGYSYQYESGHVYKHEITHEDGLIWLKINNEKIVSINPSSFPVVWTSPRTIYIYGINRGGNNKTLMSTKIERFKIKENGVVVRDMIPVLDENNIPCMYDRVSRQFFYNAGTGNFIAGPVIGSNQ